MYGKDVYVRGSRDVALGELDKKLCKLAEWVAEQEYPEEIWAEIRRRSDNSEPDYSLLRALAQRAGSAPPSAFAPTANTCLGGSGIYTTPARSMGMGFWPW